MTQEDTSDRFAEHTFEPKPDAYFRKNGRRTPARQPATAHICVGGAIRCLAPQAPEPNMPNCTGRYESDDGLVCIQINHVALHAVIWTTARRDLTSGADPDMRELGGDRFERTNPPPDDFGNISYQIYFRVFDYTAPDTTLGYLVPHGGDSILFKRGSWVVRLTRTTTDPTMSDERLATIPDGGGALLKNLERNPLTRPQLQHLDRFVELLARALEIFWEAPGAGRVDEHSVLRNNIAKAIAETRFGPAAQWPSSNRLRLIHVARPRFQSMQRWPFGNSQWLQARDYVIGALDARAIAMPGAPENMLQAFFGQSGPSAERSGLDALLMLVHECEASVARGGASNPVGNQVPTEDIRRAFGLGEGAFGNASGNAVTYEAHLGLGQAGHGPPNSPFSVSGMAGVLELKINGGTPVKYYVVFIAGGLGYSRNTMAGSDNTGTGTSPYLWDPTDLQGPAMLCDLSASAAAGPGAGYGSTALILYGNGMHPPISIDLGGLGGNAGGSSNRRRPGPAVSAGMTMARGAILLQDRRALDRNTFDAPPPYLGTAQSASSVYFERLGQALLTPLGRRTLRWIVAHELVTFVDPDGRIEIVGHADRVDSAAHNIELSQLRALNVRQAIKDMLGGFLRVPDPHGDQECTNHRRRHRATGMHLNWLGEREAEAVDADETPNQHFRRVDLTLEGHVRFVLRAP